MSGVFTIKVLTEFAAAHVIHGYDGPCSRLHGHNWKIEAEVEARELDNIGIAMDFKHLKGEMRAILDTVEHQNLNEIPPFDTINPTAENLAVWIYRGLVHRLEKYPVTLKAVNIWETDRAMISYSEL